MKKYVALALICFLSLTGLYGQKISGVCVNSKGENIAYVNIGIKGTYLSAISDARGAFLIDIPDSLSGKELTFSHISYDLKSVAIKELLRQMEFDEVRVGLVNHSFQIAQVVVKPKKQKIITLNSVGMRVPGVSGIFASPSKDQSGGMVGDTKRNISFGVEINIKNETWIRYVELPVIQSTFVQMKMRVVVYSIINGEYMPIMTEPFYFSIHSTNVKQDISCDLSQLFIRAQGKVYIAIETVDLLSEGKISFPIYVGGTKPYVKDMATGEILLEGRVVGVGLRVKGVVLDDE